MCVYYRLNKCFSMLFHLAMVYLFTSIPKWPTLDHCGRGVKEGEGCPLDQCGRGGGEGGGRGPFRLDGWLYNVEK